VIPRPLTQIAVGLLSLIAAPVAADVIQSPSNEFLETVGDDRDTDVVIAIDWTAAVEGQECSVNARENCQMASFIVEWKPPNLPATVQVVRGSSGLRGVVTTTLHDPMMRRLCWREFERGMLMANRSNALADAVSDGFNSWLESCDVMPESIRKDVNAAWAKAQPLVAQYLALIWAARDDAFVSGPYRESYKLGSFLPQEIGQPLLDMIGNGCKAVNRPKLADDEAISWEPNRDQVYPPGGMSADSCVDWQIKSFPGYPKAN